MAEVNKNSLMPQIEFTKDGKVKDFSVPDAHTLYISAYLVFSPDKKPIKKEAIQLQSLDMLDTLHNYIDPFDGLNAGKKWAITPEVIKELKSKGGYSHHIPGHPLRFEYTIRKTKHADNLKHRG